MSNIFKPHEDQTFGFINFNYRTQSQCSTYLNRIKLLIEFKQVFLHYLSFIQFFPTSLLLCSRTKNFPITYLLQRRVQIHDRYLSDLSAYCCSYLSPYNQLVRQYYQTTVLINLPQNLYCIMELHIFKSRCINSALFRPQHAYRKKAPVQI